MNKDLTELQNLLELKRHEGPSDEYFEEFLEEFHRRQRADLLKCSARSLFAERLAMWWRQLGMARWAYGAGVAYAALMVGFFAWPKGGSDNPTAGSDLPGNRTLEHVDLEVKTPPVAPEETESGRDNF